MEVKNNLTMIFGDIAYERQNNIRNYLFLGRHNNIYTFYHCQTYSHIPKQLLRDNGNLILLFKQGARNLGRVYNDRVNTDMKF